MSKVIQRLLVFFIGIPVVLSLVLFDYCNHILLHVAIIAVIIIAFIELFNLLKVKLKTQPFALTLILTLLIPISAFICVFFNFPKIYITYTFCFSCMISMAYEVFSTKSSSELFVNSIERISSSIFCFFYLGFLISFLSKMTTLSYSKIYLCLFLILVFGCDSFAWVFGMLFGKKNRGLIKASPNKSLAGFIGGLLSSIGIGLLFYRIFPTLFAQNITKTLILALLTAIFSILGDLLESVIKRSSELKDSGQLIPGRGGLLDSIDSILFATPVFYIFVVKFFQ